MRQDFVQIYRRNTWGFGSGHGSLPSVTAPYRFLVEQFVRENRPRSIVDVSFEVTDEAFSSLPAADLLLAKDVLQHWSTHDVKRFLAEALPK